MNIPNISGLVRVGKNYLAVNRPEILFGASITATLASVVLAAKGGYEARGLVEEAQNPTVDFSAIDPENLLDLKEKARLTWKCYLPAAGATIGALGSTTGLHIAHISDKKKLAVAAMSAVQEVQASADEYIRDMKDAVEENVKLTPAKREAIDNAIMEKQADRDPNGHVHVQHSDGVIEELYLVRDGRTGRDIWSNANRIEDAVNQMNEAMNHQGDVELNTFYNAAGFEGVYPEGDDWGWSGDHVAIGWKTEVRDDGRPVRRFDFRVPPTAEYNRNR